jgi:hypothetical protein
VQEGSWQRHVHPFQPPLPFAGTPREEATREEILDEVVVPLPDTSPPDVDLDSTEEIDEALA